eukprot:1842912-Lingulodinium_polyedra.AAC.1
MGVWGLIPRPPASSGIKVLKGRWADVNRGDESRPNYRSRYVAKEIKRGAKSSLVADFCAAMPPLSAPETLM